MRNGEELDDSFIKIVNAHAEEIKAQIRREEAERAAELEKAKRVAARRSNIRIVKNNDLRNEPKYNNMKPSNLHVPRTTVPWFKRALIGGAALVLVVGGFSLASNLIDGEPEIKDPPAAVDVQPLPTRTIGIDDCDLSNVHIILRAAKKGTIGVVDVCHDEYDALGISNEKISKDADIVEVVKNAQEAHPGCEILVINVETGVEGSDEYKTIIMTDGINYKTNTADTLVACMNTSFGEYNQAPDVRSGKFSSAAGRRTETTIEVALREAGLEEGVTQFTVDLLDNVINGELSRNNCASAIVEGTMRWGALPPEQRHEEVYYKVEYGDTLSGIAEKYNTTVNTLKSLSDLWDTTILGAGWTITVNIGPETAKTTTHVNNPTVTSDPNEVGMETQSYIVRPGDTLSEIAYEFGVPMSSIQTSSGNPDRIQTGEVLNISKPDRILTSEKKDLSDNRGHKY